MIRSQADPWPDFFGVALEPRAYGALLYQIAGLPLGIAAFVWVVAGLSLSLGLAIVGIGLVLGLAYLLSSRVLAVAQGRLAAALACRPAPEALAMPDGEGFWSRLRALISDPASWGAQLCLLLRMPMAIAAFTLLVILLSLSAAALLAALLPWHLASLDLEGEMVLPTLLEACFRHPVTARILTGAAGILGLMASLHLALAFTWVEAWLAQVLLRRRSGDGVQA